MLFVVLISFLLAFFIFVFLYVCLFVCLFVCFVCLFVCFVCLFVYLFCLFLSFFLSFFFLFVVCFFAFVFVFAFHNPELSTRVAAQCDTAQPWLSRFRSCLYTRIRRAQRPALYSNLMTHPHPHLVTMHWPSSILTRYITNGSKPDFSVVMSLYTRACL